MFCRYNVYHVLQTYLLMQCAVKMNTSIHLSWVRVRVNPIGFEKKVVNLYVNMVKNLWSQPQIILLYHQPIYRMLTVLLLFVLLIPPSVLSAVHNSPLMVHKQDNYQATVTIEYVNQHWQLWSHHVSRSLSSSRQSHHCPRLVHWPRFAAD